MLLILIGWSMYQQTHTKFIFIRKRKLKCDFIEFYRYAFEEEESNHKQTCFSVTLHCFLIQ